MNPAIQRKLLKTESLLVSRVICPPFYSKPRVWARRPVMPYAEKGCATRRDKKGYA
ncbi:hypothetical protein CLOSTMETH_02294 [[Clostridium] methylpentosum DSM 5476]|uniref:Uncharacterized protein n=1 Tax=[Clostridium] methylpentosum DSM 5476 TaxID=537013 RepID=C0EEK3_9FIRM|nr:hypothetical protein CLOSTMETH_02294 [[Clostridium] methylpentosum DSM 5476]